VYEKIKIKATRVNRTTNIENAVTSKLRRPQDPDRVATLILQQLLCRDRRGQNFTTPLKHRHIGLLCEDPHKKKELKHRILVITIRRNRSKIRKIADPRNFLK
jgi:hypothetical protein